MFFMVNNLKSQKKTLFSDINRVFLGKNIIDKGKLASSLHSTQNYTLENSLVRVLYIDKYKNIMPANYEKI